MFGLVRHPRFEIAVECYDTSKKNNAALKVIQSRRHCAMIALAFAETLVNDDTCLQLCDGAIDWKTMPNIKLVSNTITSGSHRTESDRYTIMVTTASNKSSECRLALMNTRMKRDKQTSA